MNEKRKKSLVLMAIWSVYVVALLIFYEKAIEFMKEGGLLQGLILYLAYNPAYMLLLYSSYRLSSRFGKHALKRMLGSICLVISFDFVAMPRFTMDMPLNLSAASTSNFGAIIIGNMDKFLPHSISFTLFYVILPIALFMLAMELMGVVDFIKNMQNGGMT